MSRPRFARKLYTLVLLASLAAGATCAWLQSAGVADQVHEEARAELGAATKMLLPFARDVIEGRFLDPDSRAKDLARAGTGRITVIERGGSVRAESELPSAEMDNHGGRPELIAAQSSELGHIRRFSRSVGEELLYVARRVPREVSGEAEDEEASYLGFVRLARPYGLLEAEISSRRFRSWRDGLICAAVAAVLGCLLARRACAPLEHLAVAADSMQTGDFGLRVRAAQVDELERIGAALNRLGKEVETRRTTMTQEEDQLRTVLTGMVEGVLALDDEDRIVLCNRAARRLLRIAEKDPRGAFLWEVVRRPELKALIERARRRERVARGDLELPTEEGLTLLEVHANAFGGDEGRGVAVVLHDVTELRRLEGIRRDFVANVSHELKTPLTSIRGYVETLLDGALDDSENNVRFLNKIDENVKRLTHLVSDLLSLGRIEAQTGALELVPVDWRDVVRVVHGHHEAAARGRDIECSLEGAAASVVVLGDQESMVQIADNLVSNAVKYTRPGGRIEVHTRVEGGFGVLEIVDTGIGIPPQDLDRVFERFFRVDKARSRELGGTGLGLSIVKHLAQAMDGTVTVESEVGRGTRFAVSLPLAEA